MKHGGMGNIRVRDTETGTSRNDVLPAAALADFYHWPRMPLAAEQCQLTRRSDWPALAAKLARTLHGPFGWPEPLKAPAGQKLASPDDNPDIPSGFTYLLQFVGHDLVNTQTPFWAVQAGLGSANLQTQPLRLGVLYGGGPGACPAAYAPAGRDGEDRCALRLSHFSTLPLPQSTAHFSDLARVAANGFTETLVADARNTDNAVLSQLTVLFALLHNSIAAAIGGNADFKPAGPPSLRPRAVFDHARAAVEQIYRRVVMGELLDKILHPYVLAAYREKHDAFWDAAGVPLELTHAVLRFGHAMVRDSYFLRPGGFRMELSENLAFAGPAASCRTEIPPLWLVQWSSFFEMGQQGVSPNYSRRIGPGMSTQFFDPGSFLPIGETPPLGLAYRDTKSGLLAGLWSVDSLVAEIETHAPALLPAGWAFRSAQERAQAIEGWLEKVNDTRNLGFTTAEIAAIAADPPLSIFVLLEAALDPVVAGRHLGVLASIIFAETLFRLAAKNPPATDVALPPAEAAKLAAIDSMAACVRYVAGHVVVPEGGLPLF